MREAETGADDDPGHRRAVEYITGADVGDADRVLVGDLFQPREQLLEQRPAAPSVDHLLVFLQ